MDITVLPNNNHPEKFLQLDVGMLPATHGMFQIGAALSGQRQWHNRVYSQVGELSLAPEQNIRLDCEEIITCFKINVHSVFFLQGEQRGRKDTERPSSPEVTYELRDSELEQHITPLTLKPNIKQNPLYINLRNVDLEENQRVKPSWTIEDYDRHSLHGNLASYLQEDPRKLNFWLEDLYTPGFDSLLKKKEAEHKRKRMCRILSSVLLSVCIIVIVITVPIVLTQKKV
ncbi:major intrinsically disordered NOTCH2-binding receptor 1-like [Tachysurus fulvidraco]|uniref:major intrinsically disordered NOTCH2-binding receptor 1-like n=1 Tax=Tachysurus fulvidraco TaxID=1234273 RepID=UPI001FEF0E84|nr:major intrinsically disordered NOTCH2-binding receptor 1-like [Tachysurus fulvidraco]